MTPPSESTAAFIPEQHRQEQYIALATFLLSFLYLCLFRRYTWIDPDEGIILQGAQRILDGQVLYRDFFSFFTPGSYYLMALCFRVFGNSMIVARTALAVIGAGCSAITYLLARRACSRSVSLLVTSLVLITALPMRFVVLHNWDSTLLAAVALYCAVRLVEVPDRKWAFATGTFTCLTCLFEQSKGACLLLGLTAGLALIAFKERSGKFLTRDQILGMAAGFAWPAVITSIYFGCRHALGAMISGWLWPLKNYTTANHVPYGYGNLNEQTSHMLFQEGPLWLRILKALIFSPTVWLSILPLLAVALLIRLVLRRRDSVAIPEWRYYVITSAAISGLLVSVIVVRADYVHFVYLQPIFLLVFAWLMDGKGIRSRTLSRVGIVVGFCMTMLLLTMGGALLYRAGGEHVIATRRGNLKGRFKDEVIEFVQAKVPPGERILVYPYESTYYYLTHTYSPSRYEYYQPGMNTRLQAQEMLSDISRDPVKIVLYDPAFAEHARASWPNTPASAFASDPVADYVQREYRACKNLHSAVDWDFQLMVRRDLECP